MKFYLDYQSYSFYSSSFSLSTSIQPYEHTQGDWTVLNSFFVLFLTIILVHFKMINKKNSTSTKELRVLFLYLYGPRGLHLPKNAPEVTSYYFHLYQINPVSATQVFYHGSQWCWCPLGTEWPEVVRYRILKNFCNSNDQGINFTWIFDFSCT